MEGLKKCVEQNEIKKNNDFDCNFIFYILIPKIPLVFLLHNEVFEIVGKILFRENKI